MKKSIKLILIILILSYGLDKVVYFSLNNISDRVLSGQAIGKLNQFLQEKDNLHHIVFGTSRANHHIDVNQFSKAGFNMGMDGSSIAYSSTLIKLLPRKKEQIVIWHIDPKRVFDHSYNADDIKGLVTKFHRNDIIKTEIKNVHQDNPIQSFYWSLDYNGKALGIIKNLIHPSYDFESYNGFDPIKVSETQKTIFEKILLRNDSKDCSDRYIISPLVKKYLEEVKRFCDENNKTLIMITSPTYKIDCANQYSALSKIFKEMNIPYYNYSSYFETNNSIDYWKDLTHLSDKGAQIFSRFLKNMLAEY